MSDKKLMLLTLLILGFGYFFVTNSLKNDSGVKFVQKEEQETAVEIKPIIVFLTVDNGSVVNTYRARMENRDTMEDFFEYLMENEDFSYEILAYVDRTEINRVNGMESPKGYVWALYNEDKPVDKAIGSANLTKNQDENDLQLFLTLEKKPLTNIEPF